MFWMETTHVGDRQETAGAFRQGVLVLIGILLLAVGVLMTITLILLPAGIVTVALGILAIMWGTYDVPEQGQPDAEDVSGKPAAKMLVSRRVIGGKMSHQEPQVSSLDKD
jgi:hypothetical protein